jgi:hypothetical protein
MTCGANFIEFNNDETTGQLSENGKFPPSPEFLTENVSIFQGSKITITDIRPKEKSLRTAL